MTTATLTFQPTQAPADDPFGGLAFLGMYTVAEYHELIRTGTLTPDDPIELLEGHLVVKMARSHAHDFAIMVLTSRFVRLAPDGYVVRSQCAATYQDSEPEPDLAIVRGEEKVYRTKHPGPADTALLVEVSATSLTRDRVGKARIYARAGVPVYWVVNVDDKVIEVYTRPSGPGDAPAFAARDEYPVGTSVPVVLDGVTVGTVAVADVMA